jgi:hypothetical protein
VREVRTTIAIRWRASTCSVTSSSRGSARRPLERDEHDVLRADCELAATGRSVLVGFDPQRRRSRELTEDERRWLVADEAGAAQRTSS